MEREKERYLIKSPFGYVRLDNFGVSYFTDPKLATPFSKECADYALPFFKRKISYLCQTEKVKAM